MKILAVSDVEVDSIYNPLVVKRFNDVDLIIACGDLPFYYQEYILSMLNRPMYYVNGNHAPPLGEHGLYSSRDHPWGGVNLHHRVIRDPSGLLLAGIEGSLRYNQGLYQYTQEQMWGMVLAMVPGLLLNRLFYGRFLDILVTHAPCWKIHDKEDLPHQGIKAFRWLVDVFQPAYHLHGHIHIYQQFEKTESMSGNTRVLNTYGYKLIDFSLPGK